MNKKMRIAAFAVLALVMFCMSFGVTRAFASMAPVDQVEEMTEGITPTFQCPRSDSSCWAKNFKAAQNSGILPDGGVNVSLDCNGGRIVNGSPAAAPTDFVILSQMQLPDGGAAAALTNQCGSPVVLTDGGVIFQVNCAGDTFAERLTLDGGVVVPKGSVDTTKVRAYGASTLTLQGNQTPSGSVTQCIVTGPSIASNGDTQLDVQDGNTSSLFNVQGSGLVNITSGALNMHSHKVSSVSNGTAATDVATFGQVFETIGGNSTPSTTLNDTAYYLVPTGTTTVVGLRYVVTDPGTNGSAEPDGGSTHYDVQLTDLTSSTVLCTKSLACNTSTGVGTVTCTSSLTAGHNVVVGFTSIDCVAKPGAYIGAQLTH